MSELKTVFGRTKENWYLSTLGEGTLVNFNTGVSQGIGVVKGVASNGVPVGGKTYILEVVKFTDMDDVPLETEYTHIALSEIMLEVRED
jgi:hypothetical protein